MGDLTASQVEGLMEAHEIDEGYDSSWSDWRWATESTEPGHKNYRGDFIPAATVHVPNLGTVSRIETYAGGEGGGEDACLIFKIVMDDCTDTVRYFRKQGYYASHDGTHWDGDFTEVKPVEKLVTVYDPI